MRHATFFSPDNLKKQLVQARIASSRSKSTDQVKRNDAEALADLRRRRVALIIRAVLSAPLQRPC